MKTGFLAKDTYDQRASALRQAEAALAMDQAAIGAATAQSRLCRNPRAVCRAARPQSGADRHSGRRRDGPLNTLVQLDPIYVTFNPSETISREIETARAAGKVEAEVSLAGEPSATRKAS